jgi:hypothetical protein
MKKLIEVTEPKLEVKGIENEGLMALMGKQVLVFCLNYIYTGKLVGVNVTCILLDKAKIVYDTGSFTSNKFGDAQALPFQQYIQTSAIESFGETDKS